MAAQNPIPPQPAPQVASWWHKHGTTAAWIAIAAAVLSTAITVSSNWYFRHTDSSAKSSDEHVNALIDAKLGPANEKAHNDLKEQLAPISGQLKELSDKLGAFDGRLTKLQARFDQFLEDQKRTSKLQLDKLDIQLKTAEKTGTAIDRNTLNRIGSTLTEVAFSNDKPTATLAWEVLNHTLSYRSRTTYDVPKWTVFHIENKNTECLKVAPHADHWIIQGAAFEHCTQHLDPIIGPEATANEIYLDRIVFKGVRVIYSGGPLNLNGIYFVNCTFEIQPSQNSRTLVETLLASNAVTLHLSYPPSQPPATHY